MIFFITKQTHKNTTEQLLTEYMNYINKHEYEKMYKMISKEHSSNISMEEFVKRNKNTRHQFIDNRGFSDTRMAGQKRNLIF